MDGDTDVHLRWNNHQTTLLSVLSSLLGNENLVDCTISAEGQYFKAHRLILSACSPYFELLFSENCETHPVVILADVRFQILKALVEFIYSGEVKVPQNKLCSFLELAETLQIKGLTADGEMKNKLGSKRRYESSILCDKQGVKKHIFEPRHGSKVEQENISSLQTSEKECAEDIDRCLLAAPISGKSSSNSVHSEKTAQEANMFQEISYSKAFSLFRCSSITKTLTKPNTYVSGTLLNSISDILNSNQLSGSYKVKVDEQRMLSENVISTHTTGEELRTSEPLDTCGETFAEDLLPQMKQEEPDNFNSNSIEEIILDDDTDENDSQDHVLGSGSHNGNTVRGLARVTVEHSFNGQGFCSAEQYRDSYFIEPASTLPNPYKCDSCGRSYQYSYGLSRHVRLECGKEPQFTCPHCSWRFHHKHSLRRHILRVHSPY